MSEVGVSVDWIEKKIQEFRDGLLENGVNSLIAYHTLDKETGIVSCGIANSDPIVAIGLCAYSNHRLGEQFSVRKSDAE